MQWIHFKTLKCFFKMPPSRLVKMMYLLHPPQMSQLWINSIMTDLPTDFLLFLPTPMMPSSILDLCGEYKSHGGSSSSLLLQILYNYNIVSGKGTPPPYNVGRSGYTHTHTHTPTHTHMHACMPPPHTHTPGRENGNLVQYSCLENSIDRGA